ncbi:branched-chain amino acid ABC transporter ATP-binding protein [Arthrobacter sp. MYb224]|nr:branched-chain amino acid ABC transporter ATP-binding protein [Arthrobacter sp. MYb224]PRA04213.1 branched-chain amino acid ABC transporter ATP-binding protein [Arthrobacter sp. MYb229]PRB51875.1 branched-chain amino acid ABC transporter ATP-binding protein [Arthrobacter sp. MYb216]
MLEVMNISAYYGDAQALEDVTLSLPAHGVTAFLGPNAAGKSTTLRVVSGLIPAATGTIEFEGRDITGTSPQERVAMGIVHVPEGRRLFNTMTVEDNLILGGYTKRKDRKTAARLDEIYDHFPKLAERRKQEAGLMSGGEQQMCAVGRGMMAGPKVLMIDEMSLGLAPVIVKQMFAIVKGIAATGMSVLLVEQHVKNALEVADFGTIIDGGITRATGTAAELRESDVVRESYLGH